MKKLLVGLENFFKGINLKKILKIFNPLKLLKIFGLKNILIVLLVVTVIALIFFGIGGGFGGGAGSGEGDGNSKVEANENNSSVTKAIEEDVIPTTEPTEEPSEEQKDGAEIFEGAVLAINVVGNDYFYNNERITLGEFLVIAKEIEGELVVEVKDDNASLNAYNNLLDELDAVNIDYVEK